MNRFESNLPAFVSKQCLNESGYSTETQRFGDIRNARNSGDVYLQLLGTESFPEYPYVLPQKLFLPPVLVSHLGKVILDTIKDEDSRERGQLIAWNSSMSIADVLTGYRNWKRKKRKFNFGKIYTGDCKSVDPKNYDDKGSKIWSRPLIDFHTQPNKLGGRAFFSPKDISYVMSKMLPSYIHLVGSNEGIYAALITKMLKTCRQDPIDIQKDLIERGFSSDKISKSVQILEDMGFGVYEWKPGHGRQVQAGDTRDGIELRRIRPGK